MMEQGRVQKDILSVIVPVRNEEHNIPIFCQRIRAVLDACHLNWEVIFVEDSSFDRTVEILYEICNEDNRFCSIFLNRSFGHHEAFTAGIEHASGEHLIMMDGDLQHPPEVIPQLLEAYNEGYDMVYAKRTTKRTFIKQLGSNIINRLINLISDYPIDISSSIFRIFSRRVADTLISMRERRRFIVGMLSWPGYKSKEITFEEHERQYGVTKYDFKKMVGLAFDAITSFSTKPLRLGIYLGFISSFLSFLVGLFHILNYFIVGVPVAGFTSIIVSLFLIGGLILFVIGIIGEYIGNIFIETKARPLYVVNKSLNIKEKAKK